MKDIRIAVQIKQVKNSEGNETLKASVPMRLIFEEDFDVEWLNIELKKFEEKYSGLVDSLKHIRNLINSGRRENKVLLYWRFGNEVLTFINENQNSALFLDNVTAHLIRDTGASEKLINRCRRFRLLYPDISKIDPSRSFDSYVVTFEGGYISAKRREERV